MNSTDFARLIELGEQKIACVKEIAPSQQRIISQLERSIELKKFSRAIDETLAPSSELNQV